MSKNIHFMGIGGSGISGVAQLALKMGYKVSGCDLEEESSYNLEGIDVLVGHSLDHIKNADLVVVTPAIFYQSNNNQEFIEAKKIGKLITWQNFLSDYLQKDKTVICIAGTHGKSTTTAMAIKLLEDADLDPLAILGAKLTDTNENYRFGKGKYFVTEADEFYNNFLNYHPEITILNNIEFDHPDYFKSEDQLFESYTKFIGNLSGKKILIVNKEDEGVNKLLSKINLEGITVIKYDFGTNDLNLELKVLGKHNVLNSLGVVALGRQLGLEDDLIKRSLEAFKGISRRLELVYDKDNIKVFDDYAHHPTAIRKTLEGLREAYPENRIWAIIEPHGYDRTSSLLHLYKGALDSTDKVIVGPIFKARDSENFGLTSDLVAKATSHKAAIGLDSFEEIQKLINSDIKEDDIIVVMGAGKSSIWAQKLLKN